MSARTKPLTGRKVLIITLMAFGTVIAANLALVYFAIGSFPGLEVKNTYVASQNFDKERAAQLALGWRTSLEYDGQNLLLTIRDVNGSVAKVDRIEATIGRATHAKDDRPVDLELKDDLFVSPAELAPGNWQLRMIAYAKDGTAFRQRLSVYVDG